MRIDVFLGLLNVLGVGCLALGPEVTSIAVSAMCGSGFLAMSVGVIVVDSCMGISEQKEKENGTR